MKVYFIRHGDVDNPLHLKYGRLPAFHLSLQGRDEVERLSLKLANFGIEVIFSSPLERTTETSQILSSSLHVPVNFDDRLLEFNVGKYEGMKEEDYIAGEYWKKGAETLEDSGARIMSFLDETKKDATYKTIAVVSHEGPIVMALLSLSGKTVSDYSSITLKTGDYIEVNY